MFCKNCGSQIADDAIFCSQCGTRLVDELPQEPAMAEVSGGPAVNDVEQDAVQTAGAVDSAAASIQSAQTDAEIPAKPFLEEMSWSVSEYPDSNVVEKTEDIDFDWGLDPDEIREPGKPTPPAEEAVAEAIPEPVPAPKSPEEKRVAEVFDRVVPAEEAKASIPVKEAMEAAGKIDAVGQFNTFNKKNAQFQELLDREYEKVRGAGPIGGEQEEAEEVASRRFDSHKEEMTMDEFLQQEGAVKLYEPKEVETDVLDRIAIQDKQRAQKEAEEAARMKALEEARQEALEKKRAEEEQMNAQAEAMAAAEAEIRAGEEEAARKVSEEAARLEAIARRQAEEEARAVEEERRRAAEEARARAEEEARLRQEELARAKAEEEARAQAEEAARAKAEAELKAAQEAARIRAQQEAANAAREEAEFKAAQERRQREEEIARLKKEAEEKQQARAESSAAVEDEVRKALEQTAKMRQEEEDKIKAALAGIRGGRFSDTISSTVPADGSDEEAVVETAVETVAETPEQVEEAVQAESPEKAEAGEAEMTPEAPAEEEIPAQGQTMTDRGTIFAAKDEIEAAHRHTRYNIEGMAKAREDFFADLPGGDPQAERQAEAEKAGEELISPLTRTVDKEAIAAGLSSTKKLSRDELDMSAAIKRATERAVSEEAEQAPEPEMPEPFEEEATEAVQKIEERGPVKTEDLLNQFASMAGTEGAADRVEEMPVIEEPVSEPEAIEAEPAEELVLESPVEDASEELTLETAGEEATEELSLETPEGPAVDGMDPQMAEEDLYDLESLTQPEYDDPSLQALMSEKPGLEDTMVMPEVTRIDELTSKEIDSYEEADPEELRALKDAAATQKAIAAEEAAAAAAEMEAAEEKVLQPDHETAQQIASDMASRVEDMPQEITDAPKIDGASELTAGIAAVEASLAAGSREANDIQTAVAQAEAEQEGAEPALSPRELKKQERAAAKEAKRLAKQKKKEEKRKDIEDTFGEDEAGGIVEEKEQEKKGGKGRLVLMIILILLCIIFALELVGIGIKMFASTSAAAEFIDNILNSLIHMITGNGAGGSVDV